MKSLTPPPPDSPFSSPAGLIDSTLFVGLIVLSVWVPLPFGSVEGWARGVMHVSLFVLLVIWSFRFAIDSTARLKVTPVVFFFLAAIGLVGLQLLPGMPAALRSIDPFLTYLGFLHLLSLAVLYLLVVNVVTSEDRLRWVFWTLGLWGGAVALYAVIQHFMGQGQYAAFRKLLVAAPFGTFVNRNHFAGYAEMVAPLALTFAAYRRSRGDDLRVFFLIGAILIFLALILSGSRGGWLSGLAVMVCFGSLAYRIANRSSRASLAGLVLIPVMVAAGVWWMGIDPLVDRLNTNDQESEQLKHIGRFSIWRNTLNIVRTHPVAGTGFGTYEVAYPQWDSSDGRYRVEQAHNDYLQCLAELGLVGGVLVAAFLGWFFRATIRSITDRKTSTGVRWMRLGCLCGVVGLLVHSFVDFNLQIPSNAYYFVLLIGLATADVEESGDPDPARRSLAGGRQQVLPDKFDDHFE
jgi:O-antigen ligase